MVRVRFAPSPTGVPHIGNTRTALYNYVFAQKNQGQFVLRIEDTDRARLQPDSLPKILAILKAVGIAWDEGPFAQSERLKIYQDHAEKLVKSGKAYYCFCTQERLSAMRKAQQKRGALPRYDRRCLKLTRAQVKTQLAKRTPHVIRLKVPDTGETSWVDLIQGKISFKNNQIDDQVLLKSDQFPTYHLGVVVDDHLMKVSHILRGVEWISSTPKHLLLYQAFGWPVPKIGHFPVILGPDHAKLSKRHGAKSVLDYLDEGYLVEPLITFMAYLGWSHNDNSELLNLKKLVKLFDLKKVQKQNPIFDLKKLNYFNAKYIRQLSNQELFALVKPRLKFKLADAKLTSILPLVRDRLVTLNDINLFLDYFAGDIKAPLDLIVAQSGKDRAAVKTALGQTVSAFAKNSAADWQEKNLEKIGHDLIELTGWTTKELFMTLRVSLTGKVAPPPLFALMEVLGPEVVSRRLQAAHEAL